MIVPISKHRSRRVIAMWIDGWDTLSISKRLVVPEATVYNILARWRA